MERRPVDRWFFIINRHRHAFMHERLGGGGLEPRMMPYLHHIQRGAALSQEELSAVMGLDKTTVAHAVKVLVEKGYVARTRDEVDRRVYRLSLSPEGEELYRGLSEVFKAWNAGLFEGFSDAELDELESIFKRLAENAARLTYSGDSSCCADANS
jgi:DNA-binding MarR family transcriptional regulator